MSQTQVIENGISGGATHETTNRSDLLHLFQQYPALKSQLKAIFEVAVGNENHAKGVIGSSKSVRNNQSVPNDLMLEKRKPSNEQQESLKALRMLQEQMSSESPNSAAFKAFAALVMERQG